MRGKMKKILPITFMFIFFLMFSGCNIFDYNGKASIILKNIGELIMYAQVESGYSVIEPGEEDTFKLTWPGHDDMLVNLITYPYHHPEVGETQHFYISDGEEKVIQKGYYMEDLTAAKK
jgi:hypothetical protein